MSYRKQHNLTISKEQQDFIKSNDGKMSISQLSKLLGMSFNKIQNNRKLLGLVKPRNCKIIKMEGYFDVDNFGKTFYNY